LLVAIVQVILVIRVRAFYVHNAFLRMALLGLLGAELIAQLVILIKTLVEVISKAGPGHEPGVAGCFTMYAPTYWTEYWLPCLIFESILFALVIARVVNVMRRGWGSTSLYMLFVHDGVVFFALLFVGLLTNMFLLFFEKGALGQIAVAWLLAFFSLSGARIHLNQQETRAQLTAAARHPRGKKPQGKKSPHDFGFDFLPATPAVPFHSPYAGVRYARSQPALGADSMDAGEHAYHYQHGRGTADAISSIAATVTTDTTLEFVSGQSSGNARVARHYDPGDVYVPVTRREDRAIAEEHSWEQAL
jgi:hypothetical protein